MIRFNRFTLFSAGRLLLILSCLSLSACAGLDPFTNNQEELDKSITLFNRDFETMSVERCAVFLLPKHKEEFISQMYDLKEKISFYESNVISMKFYKDDVPIKVSADGKPTDTANQTVVIIRYKLSILPSTRLKTLIVSQEWVFNESRWYVTPNLDQFLK